MKITIAKKIAVPFLVILLLLVGMISTTYQGFKRVSIALDNIELENIKRNHAGNLRFSITQLLMPANDFIITGRNRYINEFDSLIQIVNANLHAINQLSLTENEEQLLSQIKNDLDSISFYANRIFSIPKPRQSLMSSLLMETIDYRFGAEVNKKTTEIFDGISKRVDDNRLQAATVKESVTSSILLIIFLTVFIGLIISYLTVQRISKPIVAVAKSADSIASGDYSQRVRIKTHDEVARLAKSFNVMAESIQQSHKALKESKRLTSSIVSTINIGLIVFDAEGKILSANPAFYGLLGLELGSTKNIVDILEKLNVAEECKNCILSRKFISGIECNYLDSVKGGRTLHLTVYPMPQTEDESLLFIEDITKRKHDEQIVINSEKYFRALIENSTDGLAVISPKGYLLYESPSNKNITGYEHNELINQNILKLFHTDDLPAINDLLMSLLEEPLTTVSRELRFQHKDGNWLSFEAKMRNALNQSAISGIVINFRDITERVKAKAVIEEQAEQLRAILANTSDGFWIVDQSGKIVEANEAYCKMSGYTCDEIRHLNISELDAKESSEDVAFHIKRVIENGSDIFDTVHITKDGAHFFVEVVAIYNPKRKQILGFFRNITERKKLEASILQQLKFTNALNEISNIIISTEEKNVILQKTSDILGETLNVDRCLIYNVSFEKKLVIGLCEWLNPGLVDIDPTKGTYPLDIFIGGATQMLKSKQWLESHINRINTRLAEDESGEILHQQMKIKSLLWYPFSFFADDYYLLVLNAINSTREWTKEEIDFLESVSKQLSIALEKIRLLEEKAIADKLVVEQSNILRSILDNSPIGIWMLNKEGRMKFVNKTFCDAIGITEEKFLSAMHYSELYDEETAQNCMQSDKEAFAITQPFTSHEKIKFADGELHDLEIIKKKVTNNEEDTLGLIGISLDISERLRTEEELIKIKTVVEQTADCVVITDRNGRIQYVNQAFTNESGYSREEVVGKTSRILKSGRHSEEFYESLWKTILSGEVFRATFMNKRKDGELIYEFKTITPIKDYMGSITHFVSTAKNITEQYYAQQEIISQKNKFAQLFDNSPIAIALLDAQDRVSIINESFSALFGYYIDEIEGKSLNDLIVPDEFKKEAEANSFETMEGNQVNKESYRKKKDGSLAYVQIVGVPVIVNDIAIGFYGMYVDLTHIKKAEEELIAAKEKAEEMNRLKSNFLANMSHELRTPLNGILGFASILSSSIDNPEYNIMAQSIFTSGKRLSETLNLILDLSKAETEDIVLHSKSINIIPVVNRVVELFSEPAGKKNLLLETVIANENLYAKLDENLFERTINNLVSNAIKFTDNGKISVKVGKETTEGKDWIYIQVKDTGIGIPEDKIDLIWEEFRQVSEGFSRSFEGTGLGLTISKRIVQLMNGVITVESKVGEGSVFTVKFLASDYIPEVVEVKREKEVLAANPVEKKMDLTSSHSVLYVEDDLINQSVVKFYLRNFCMVETAKDGESALQLVAEKKYDLVLMDINLGSGMDGMAVTKEIRKMPQYAETPIIAVTAYAMDSDREEFLSGGCSHYLSKPFEKQELLELIASIVIK
jgi:PAS domain S-box-containing protein